MKSTAVFTSCKRALYAALVTGLAVTTLACSGAAPAVPQPTAAGQPAVPQPAAGGGQQFTFAVITHSDGTDNFWPVVKNGAEAAGKALGVNVNYTFSGDPLKQSQLIDNAVSQKVDGIAVSMANPDALKASIQKAEQAGIPVITINSGEKQFKDVGALTHVGQDEVVAGRGAGERLKAASLTNILCLIHEAGNVALSERCQGATETFGGKVTQLQVNLANLPDVTATVSAKLQADPSIDGVLALNPGVATAALAATKQAGGKAKLATFDLSKDIVKSIEAGDVLFAVDQQQYLQGYLPVIMLYLYKTNLNTVGGGQPILTGPGFVTQDNAKQVEDLAAKGTR